MAKYDERAMERTARDRNGQERTIRATTEDGTSWALEGEGVAPELLDLLRGHIEQYTNGRRQDWRPADGEPAGWLRAEAARTFGWTPLPDQERETDDEETPIH